MNSQRVTQRGLQYSHAQSGELAGFRLVFNKMSRDHSGCGHANIVYAREALVEGVLYTLESEQEILKMDPFEHAPWNYGRDVFVVQTEAGKIWSWSYIANAAVCQAGLHPSPDYLDHLLAGKPYLSRPYYAELKTCPTSTM